MGLQASGDLLDLGLGGGIATSGVASVDEHTEVAQKRVGIAALLRLRKVLLTLAHHLIHLVGGLIAEFDDLVHETHRCSFHARRPEVTESDPIPRGRHHVQSEPMLEYLSPEWFEAAETSIRADETLQRASAEVQLVLQQTVHDADHEITWHVSFDRGSVRLVVGPAAEPSVTFSCDRPTAVAVATGATSAQAAFMSGNLRIGGDVRHLLANAELLASLDDALAPLRD